jgi:hypothetical protein
VCDTDCPTAQYKVMCCALWRDRSGHYRIMVD